MPDYDYKCKKCNKVFTIEKSMIDSTVPDCPVCKSFEVSRIWGGIQFKGLSKGSKSSSNCGSCSGGSCSGCGS